MSASPSPVVLPASHDGRVQFRARILRRIFHNEQNGYTVLSVLPGKGGEVIVVCNTPLAPLEGEAVHVQGTWTMHKGNKQFKADSIEVEVDRSDSGMIAWLHVQSKAKRLEGVGKTTIMRVSKLFRGRVSEVIANVDAMVAGGLQPAKAKVIAKAWLAVQGYAEFSSSMLELGFTTKQIKAAEDVYGLAALRVARETPWDLCQEVDGIGFLTCDKIAVRAGLDLTCDDRLLAGLGWVLHEKLVQNGHSGVPLDYLAYHAARLLSVSRALVDRACSTFVDGKNIILDESVGLVYGRVLLEAEKKVATRLVRLRDAGQGSATAPEAEQALLEAEKDMGLTLDRKGGQFEAAMMALTEPVSVITGGPGTGKSTIQKVVVSALQKLGRTIIRGAPTGRAAKRLAETSARTASTIHRMLEFDTSKNDFNRNETRPLGESVVIVDEFSMVDLRLAACLLAAVRLGTTLIMVGDFDQLPSVGPGQVLRDIIESGEIPVSCLTVVRRQVAGSGIALAASRVRDGIAPWEGEELLADDFRIVERDDDSIRQTILSLIASSEQEGISPIRDIQVLAAMHKGDAGVESLNVSIKDMLNPVVEGDGRSIQMGYRWFTVGDRVMKVKNDYKKGVQNGEVGVVTAVGKSDKEKPYSWVIAEYGGTVAEYVINDIENVVLAYAATVHKSQGCEFPLVIVSCPSMHSRMLSRNLLYTAMTRARRRCILVGMHDTIESSAAMEDAFKRFSALRQRLQA